MYTVLMIVGILMYFIGCVFAYLLAVTFKRDIPPTGVFFAALRIVTCILLSSCSWFGYAAMMKIKRMALE